MNTKHKEITPIDEDAQYLIDQLYTLVPTRMVLPNGDIEEIHPDGNIGLLAVGYKGIVAWRKKREALYGSRLYSPLLEALKKIAAQRKEEGNE
jgi:hypothetical protein